jgi:hypothetical protein
LIIPLIIQTIRQVPSGSAGIDGAPNVRVKSHFVVELVIVGMGCLLRTW